MENKERLEEIKASHSLMVRNGYDLGYWEEPFNWLIEQAERAEYNNIWSERVRKYKEQNERYREYLGRLQRASKRYPTEDLPHVINKITSEALEDTQ